jgi:hypothetical protein
LKQQERHHRPVEPGRLATQREAAEAQDDEPPERGETQREAGHLDGDQAAGGGEEAGHQAGEEDGDQVGQEDEEDGVVPGDRSPELEPALEHLRGRRRHRVAHHAEASEGTHHRERNGQVGEHAEQEGIHHATSSRSAASTER